MAIRERMVIRRASRGDHLYRQRSGAFGLYQVLSGHVQLRTVGPTGNEMLVTIYGPGSVLGEIPLMSTINRSFDAVVMGAAEIAELSRSDFDDLARQFPEIHQQLTEKLCHTIVALLMHIEDTSLLNLSQRLAKLLCSAARAYGRPAGETVVIDLPLTQSDIGNMLGVSRQSIHREMAKWKSDRTVVREAGSWVIRPAQLSARVGLR